MKGISMGTSWSQTEDRRESPRVRLQLRLAMIYPQQADRPARPMFHGKTRDIGMSGLSMVVEYNIFQEGEVAVVLALPPADAEAPRRAVAATAEMTYAIHSSKLNAFKIGLTFREFRGDGKQLLEEFLQRATKEAGIDPIRDPYARVKSDWSTDSQLFGW